MAASCPLPETLNLPMLLAKLQGLLRFLKDALHISNAHTVDFYTESLWDQLVALPPETVLAALRRSAAEPSSGKACPFMEAERESGIYFSKIFCETSQKLVSVEAFALAAKYYSLQNLGICTPFDQLLVALQGNRKQRTGMYVCHHVASDCSYLTFVLFWSGENVKPDEFMNMKKSHEVCVMSELISSTADFCGIKQVIDLGSGKGYLSSFLSLKYGLKVYGIDSSDVSTHGAEKRNRKLKKHWRVYHTRSRLDVSGLALKMAKERKVKDKIQHKADAEEKCNNRMINPEEMAPSGFLPGFSDTVISNIPQQIENQHGQPQQEENWCFENVFPFIDILPINAVEPTSSSQISSREISEASKERRKKTSQSNESSIYSPLTSFITADSELCDIIEDLEDCLMVGLHTCGDLAPNTLRIFASKYEIKGVCSVGCCYHLLSEEFENQHIECTQEKWGFPMCRYLQEERWCCGRNARMSACLALERVAVGQGLPIESLFYRAVLQDIIKDCYGITKCDRHVGKIYSKSSSFLDYVRKSLKKLGLDESKQEQEDIAWSTLVKLFDPVKSPRCYAVIALKKQQ
ncbi:methyltransferase-like protein 25 [Orycteropus afer afer]|uniref:Methyltransferase-like protein 25 n=1 Tax=Orycteropus afer afer TaxID=1230840 RepID=A0AC54ZD40_ORYAF|nr:methyltransferase-like protein 25 [Orycteropus afer afer]